SWRRATSDTVAPGANVSSTIRALSSDDHRRRPPTPVSISSRRTSTGLGLSVGLNPDMKRSAQGDRHHRRPAGSKEGGVRTALTLNDAGVELIATGARSEGAGRGVRLL